MKIPKYWSRQRVSRVILWDHLEITCAGWSYESISEAIKNAITRGEKVLAAIERGTRDGEYLYADRPIKEEIVSELEEGNLKGRISRS